MQDLNSNIQNAINANEEYGGSTPTSRRQMRTITSYREIRDMRKSSKEQLSQGMVNDNAGCMAVILDTSAYPERDQGWPYQVGTRPDMVSKSYDFKENLRLNASSAAYVNLEQNPQNTDPHCVISMTEDVSAAPW